MFQLREINQIDMGTCQYLEWELNVDPVTLHEFEEDGKRWPRTIPYIHSPVLNLSRPHRRA